MVVAVMKPQIAQPPALALFAVVGQSTKALFSSASAGNMPDAQSLHTSQTALDIISIRGHNRL